MDPVPNGEGSSILSFNFVFLRESSFAANNPAFNDKSNFKPTSQGLENNGFYYTITYWLPPNAAPENYDHEIVKQMDAILDTVEFIPLSSKSSS